MSALDQMRKDQGGGMRGGGWVKGEGGKEGWEMMGTGGGLFLTRHLYYSVQIMTSMSSSSLPGKKFRGQVAD